LDNNLIKKNDEAPQFCGAFFVFLRLNNQCFIMKKVILLMLILFMISPKSKAQTSVINSDDRSFVVQTADTVKSIEVTKINNSLTAFYKANRSSQLLILGGVTVAVLGTLLFQKEGNKINPFIIFGGAAEFAGFIVYMDSFKYLNLNKKKQTAKLRKKNFDDVYFY